MKKITSLLLLVLFNIVVFTACSNNKPAEATAAAPKATETKAVETKVETSAPAPVANNGDFKLPFEQPASAVPSKDTGYDPKSIASTVTESLPIPNTALEVVDNAKVDPAKYPLKGSHLENSLDCASCHVDGDYNKRVTQETCFTCHENYEALAERTKDLGYDDNIHASPHYPKMDCDLCHKIHKPEGNVYCITCHSQESLLKLKTP